MGSEVISLRDKKIEQSLIRIGSKIADAVEMGQQAKMLSLNSTIKLVQASLELEELYWIIGEDVQLEMDNKRDKDE